MSKAIYERPKFEVCRISIEDVVRTSNDPIDKATENAIFEGYENGGWH